MSTRGESEFAELEAELDSLRLELEDSVEGCTDVLARVHPAFAASARNLLHYVALRQRDARDLQFRLARLGLSSLGRSECHVLSSVEAVLSIARRLAGGPTAGPAGDAPSLGLRAGRELLAEHTDALFGPRPATHGVRVMVTMPADAATDYELVRALLRGGMDVMRVNCAHDDPAAWARMAEHLRRARRELGRSCRLYMDVAGPKLRTGVLEGQPGVVRIRPRRDRLGRVTAPARVLLHPPDSDPAGAGADAALPAPAAWLADCRPGDVIEFVDARGSRRRLSVVAAAGAARWAVGGKTAYVVEGTRLERTAVGGRAAADAGVGALPEAPLALVLRPGDRIVLTNDRAPGRAAVLGEGGRPVAPATIPCTLPEVFERVRPGDRVLFDDGRIGGVARAAHRDRVEVEITRARPTGDRLRSDKGINLPDTDLGLPPLTPKDLDDLPVIAKHADIVGYSFVRSAEGVHELSRRLDELGREDAGLVLKIESRPSFEHLPALLLAVMRRARAGVMIARGDLAVECGFERLAEVQEEILWICEAAHVPVIWATAVLDQLAKRGAPTRAEITDAAMAERAECVMLNKGPHILAALAALVDILRRMESHQSKKSPLLRRLRSW